MTETYKPSLAQVSTNERYGLLVIVAMPQFEFEQLGSVSYEKWFADAIGMAKERVHAINATNEPFPTEIPESGVIIGGSFHSVYEDLPWISRLKGFVGSVAEMNKPLLGVCFGHQVIAEALGGKVEKAPKGREFGATTLHLTEKGQKDPLFEGMEDDIELAVSYSDVVTKLPQRGDVSVLANNNLYPYQVLGIGDKIRTLQPHPEITSDILQILAATRMDMFSKEGYMNEEDFDNFMETIRNSAMEIMGKKVLQNFNNNFVRPYSHM